VELLRLELSAANARELFERVRRLVHHLRARPEGLPHWLGDFVATGYQHYASLLPQSFADRGTSPEQLAGMLAFVFSLENLALSLGCQRSQVIIAVRQAAPLTTDPGKLGLLWAAEWTLELKRGDEVRAEFNALMDNPMSLSALPGALGSLLLALSFTPLVSALAAELLSRAFMELPESLLLPWLPGLLDSLRPVAGTILPALMREVVQSTPRSLRELDAWTPPWEAPRPAATATPPKRAATADVRSPEERAVNALLRAAPAATDAWAEALGLAPGWTAPPAEGAAEAEAHEAEAPGGDDPNVAAIQGLLTAYPTAVSAWAARLNA
jgi:hypothetical protein